MADQDLTQKIEEGVGDIDKEEVRKRIRLAAYGIWEEEGKPDGRADDHWHEAERRARSGSDYVRRDDSGEPARPDPANPPKDAADGRPTTGADSTARPSARTGRES